MSKPWNSHAVFGAQRRVTCWQRRSEHIHASAHTEGGSRERHQTDTMGDGTSCCSPNISLPPEPLTTWRLGGGPTWPCLALELWAAVSQDHLMDALWSDPYPEFFGSGTRTSQAVQDWLFPFHGWDSKHREVALTQSHTDKKQNCDVSLSHLALGVQLLPTTISSPFPSGFPDIFEKPFYSPTCSLPCDFLEWQLWYSTL